MTIDQTQPTQIYQTSTDELGRLRPLPPDVDAAITQAAREFRVRAWREHTGLAAAFDRVAVLYAEERAKHLRKVVSSAFAEGFEAGASAQATQTGVPKSLHQALVAGGVACTVPIEGLDVTVQVGTSGTGVPNPASGPAWIALSSVIHRVATENPPCGDVLAPDLPEEITSASWVGSDGRSVRVIGSGRRKARHSRGIPWRPLGIAGIAGWAGVAIHRLGMSATTTAATVSTGAILLSAATYAYVESPSTPAKHSHRPAATREAFVPPLTGAATAVTPSPTAKPSPSHVATTSSPRRVQESAPAALPSATASSAPSAEPSTTPEAAPTTEASSALPAASDEPIAEAPVDTVAPPASAHGHGIGHGHGPKVVHVNHGRGGLKVNTKTNSAGN